MVKASRSFYTASLKYPQLIVSASFKPPSTAMHVYSSRIGRHRGTVEAPDALLPVFTTFVLLEIYLIVDCLKSNGGRIPSLKSSSNRNLRSTSFYICRRPPVASRFPSLIPPIRVRFVVVVLSWTTLQQRLLGRSFILWIKLFQGPLVSRRSIPPSYPSWLPSKSNLLLLEYMEGFRPTCTSNTED